MQLLKSNCLGVFLFVCSIAVPRILFDLGIEKNIKSGSAFLPLCCDFYGLLIATSINHWVPRTLFIPLLD